MADSVSSYGGVWSPRSAGGELTPPYGARTVLPSLPMPLASLVPVAALVGLIVGSFLNVVSHRVPRKESVVRPASRCPACQTQIAPRDNIPVLSWLVLRGQCRGCAAPISARYPAVEVATSILFTLAAFRFGFTVELVAFALLFAVLVAVTAIDLEFRLIPKRIVWPTFAFGAVLLSIASLVQSEPRRLFDAGVGAVGAFVLLFLIHLISPRGMGFGDVRLAMLLGLFLGWLGPAHVALGLFGGFMAGGVTGIVALAVGRSRKSALPFAPFLAFGTVVAVGWGEPILDWYLGFG